MLVQVETRQMYSIKTGQRPVAIVDICLVSTADICPVSAADTPVMSQSQTSGGWVTMKPLGQFVGGMGGRGKGVWRSEVEGVKSPHGEDNRRGPASKRRKRIPHAC